MWFTITLREINNIPKGTMVKITEYDKMRMSITIETMSPDKYQRVIMNKPQWWIGSIGFQPEQEIWERIKSIYGGKKLRGK